MSITIIPIADELPAISRPHINTNFTVIKASIDALQARLARVAIAYAATLATNAALGGVFEVAPLTGPATLSNPTGMVDGQVVTWIFVQDATGSRVVTLGSKFLTASSMTLTWSTAANKVDLLSAQYRLSIDKWLITRFVPGYANA